jgi:hypothetical protein
MQMWRKALFHILLSLIIFVGQVIASTKLSPDPKGKNAPANPDASGSASGPSPSVAIGGWYEN